MSCPTCMAGGQIQFFAEMIVHHGGLKNLDKSGVALFPKILICSHCGFSQFTVPEAQLASLVDGTPTNDREALAEAG
jgi:hypothetical protein